MMCAIKACTGIYGTQCVCVFVCLFVCQEYWKLLPNQEVSIVGRWNITSHGDELDMVALHFYDVVQANRSFAWGWFFWEIDNKKFEVTNKIMQSWWN